LEIIIQEIRAANGNTGRLYFGQKSQGDEIAGFGPVCPGNSEKFIGSYWKDNPDMNNKKAYFLGSSICKYMRMGDFKFLGLWKDYYEFMKKEKLSAYRMDQDCFAAVPEYMIAGASTKCNATHKRGFACKNINNWKFAPFALEGGTCLKNVSDIFIHCDEPAGGFGSGQWSSWSQQRFPPAEGYFRQRWRTCIGHSESGISVMGPRFGFY